MDVVIRPEDVEIMERGKGIFPATVTSVLFKGVHYEIMAEGIGIQWMIHTTVYHEKGAEVDLYVKPFNIQIMNKPESEDEDVIHEE